MTKLKIVLLMTKYFAFYGTWHFTPCLQQVICGLNPEQDKSSPHNQWLLIKNVRIT